MFNIYIFASLNEFQMILSIITKQITTKNQEKYGFVYVSVRHEH